MNPSFICPACRTPLEPSDAALLCPREGTLYRQVDGIWRFLNGADHRRFLECYTAVRRDEAWGSDTASYFLALPYRDLSRRHPEIWRIRAVSYRALQRRVLRRFSKPITALDLGAGNAWLSYRLREAGHRPSAVDLSVDPRDGLGACRHYPEAFPAVQASFDRLPWPDKTFDLVIYNGSLHYSADYAVTLREALRLLAPGGHVVVMDTPIYRRRASGDAMLREREAALAERYGQDREGRHEGYLTRDRMMELGEEIGLSWRVIRPFYGLRWALIPWKARLLGRRELMRFYLLLGSPLV